jgi:hypothetical protein
MWRLRILTVEECNTGQAGFS